MPPKKRKTTRKRCPNGTRKRRLKRGEPKTTRRQCRPYYYVPLLPQHPISSIPQPVIVERPQEVIKIQKQVEKEERKIQKYVEKETQKVLKASQSEQKHVVPQPVILMPPLERPQEIIKQQIKIQKQVEQEERKIQKRVEKETRKVLKASQSEQKRVEKQVRKEEKRMKQLVPKFQPTVLTPIEEGQEVQAVKIEPLDILTAPISFVPERIQPVRRQFEHFPMSESHLDPRPFPWKKPPSGRSYGYNYLRNRMRPSQIKQPLSEIWLEGEFELKSKLKDIVSKDELDLFKRDSYKITDFIPDEKYFTVVPIDIRIESTVHRIRLYDGTGVYDLERDIFKNEFMPFPSAFNYARIRTMARESKGAQNIKSMNHGKRIMIALLAYPMIDKLYYNLPLIVNAMVESSFDKKYFVNIYNGITIYFQDPIQYLLSLYDDWFATVITKDREKAYSTTGLRLLLVAIREFDWLTPNQKKTFKHIQDQIVRY